jgi:hypothetical protein
MRKTLKRQQTNAQFRSCARLLLALLITLDIAACAHTRTTTNVAPGYTGHPTRFFVVANLSAFGPGFSEDFQSLLEQRIKACGGDVEFSNIAPSEVANPLALQPEQTDASKARVAEMHRFNPDAVLLLRVNNVGTTNGQLTSATVHSKVFDTKLNKEVWAAVSNEMTGGMFTPTSTRAQSLYEDLSAKLQRDGIICATAKTDQASANGP